MLNAQKCTRIPSSLTLHLRGFKRNPNSSLLGMGSSFAIHDSPFPANILSWVGAAIYSSLEGLATRSVSQETFRETRTIPDWAALQEKEASEDTPSAASTLEKRAAGGERSEGPSNEGGKLTPEKIDKSTGEASQ